MMQRCCRCGPVPVTAGSRALGGMKAPEATVRGVAGGTSLIARDMVVRLRAAVCNPISSRMEW